jgi:hypothetical protein
MILLQANYRYVQKSKLHKFISITINNWPAQENPPKHIEKEKQVRLLDESYALRYSVMLLLDMSFEFSS